MEAGVAALRAGRPADACAAFEAAIAGGRGDAQAWLYLGHARLLVNDRERADAALAEVLAREPRNLTALCLRGDIAGARGDDRAAASFYGFALSSVPAGGVSGDVAELLDRARAGLATAQTRFRARLEAGLGVNVDAQPPRFREAMTILSGERPVQLQQPTSFYYPGLAPTPFFSSRDFPWVDGLIAAAPSIRDELDRLAGDAGFAPYVQATRGRPNKGHALLDDPRWSAMHLWRDGAPVPENASRCPATMEALASTPMPIVRGRSPMALFSMLRPRTHIPLHHGMLNTRLICHLPLIVPPGCRLRVGNETRVVKPFVPLIFDDSMEHEAWNDSDEIRIVLLFEIWRPDLDDAERAMLTRMFETVVDYDR